MSEESKKPSFAFTYKGKKWPMVATEGSIDAMLEFEVREDDVFVVTYIKSGTHWMSEIVQLILNNGDASKIERRLDLPLEYASFKSTHDAYTRTGRIPLTNLYNKHRSPRVIPTHTFAPCLPEQIWDKKCPVIYVARNAKDVAVSLYNFLGKEEPFKALKSFTEFYEYFDSGDVSGLWHEHVQEFWALREKNNVLYVTYEEMHKDIVSVIRSVAKLLGREPTDALLQRVAENVKIGNMKNNLKKAEDTKGIKLQAMPGSKGASYLNKGVSGRWKQFFTVGLNERHDQKYTKIMKDFPELAWRLEM